MSIDKSRVSPETCIGSLNKIADAMQMAGKVLPASVVSRAGNMVTVSFLLRDIPFMLPQVTLPLFGPQYIRYPMQPGTGDRHPGGYVSGRCQRTGRRYCRPYAAGQSQRAGVLPISHTEWESVDGHVLTLYGPEGVTIRDAGSKTTFLLTPQSITIATPDQFKVTVGSTVLTLTNGSWSLTGQSGTLADGQASTSPAIMHEGWQQLLTWVNSHQHSNGNGGQNTGGPTTSFDGSITE